MPLIKLYTVLCLFLDTNTTVVNTILVKRKLFFPLVKQFSSIRSFILG